MPESATQRIAAKLAAKKAATTSEPAESEFGTDAAGDDDQPTTYEDDQLEASQDGPEPDTTHKAKTSVAERAKAARLARAKAQADADAADADAVKEPTPITDAPSVKAKTSVKVAKATSKQQPVPVPVPASIVALGGKKPPSPAQLAARAAFAARSKEKAAASAKAKAKVNVKPAGEPVQTEAEVRASQSAKRKAEREAAAAKVEPKRTPTSRSVAVQAPAPAPARAPKVKEAPKVAHATRGGGSGTKEKVLALWAKGQTRQQIMATLGLSYPSVFYHTKNTPGTGSLNRGRIFVDTNLDENGEKRRGKPEQVSRSEAIRRRWLSGEEIGDIARDLGTRYQVAYTAIRPLLLAAADAE